MKQLLWSVVIYEAVVGLAELTWVAAQNQQIASIASAPSVSSAFDSVIGSTAGANYIEGSIDLAVAAAVYFFGIKGR